MIPSSLSATDNALRESLEYMEREVGGRIAFIRALSSSRNPAAKALVLALGKAGNDDKPIFEVALTIKKDPWELAKAFSEGVKLQNVTEAVTRLFTNLPDVLDAGIKAAKISDKEGTADRKMLYQIAGLFPAKGAGVAVTLNQNFEGAMSAGGKSPAAGTHDLLHSNPFDDSPIDVEVLNDDDEKA